MGRPLFVVVHVYGTLDTRVPHVVARLQPGTGIY